MRKREVVEISTSEASFMAIEIDSANHCVQIKWLRPVTCDECVRGVHIAVNVSKELGKLRRQPYSLIEE